MRGKWAKSYLLLGSIVIFAVAVLGSLFFVKDNIKQAENKYNFESIYINTFIDFIIPSPSFEQISVIENSGDTGIAAITPYYETTSKVQIEGKSCNGITIIIPDDNKVVNTPYTSKRIIEGDSAGSGQAVVDKIFAEKNSCKLGDIVDMTIADRNMSFKIVGIAETNTYSKDGTIALVLNSDDRTAFLNQGIKYSAAYVKASDYEKCKSYLFSEYKPYGRLKDISEFSSEDAYNQHLDNFENADWTKEITNCADNYDSLKVKYENVESTVYRNLIIYSVIIIIGILAINLVFLNSASIQKAMKINLVKKGGTVADTKKFYYSGICFNLLEYVLSSGVLYYYIASDSILGITGKTLINLGIPIAAAVIVSILMLLISGAYAGKKYRLKKSEVESIKKELGIPVNESEK